MINDKVEYNTSSINLETKLDIIMEAYHNNIKWWIDKLDSSISWWSRQKTDMLFEEFFELITDKSWFKIYKKLIMSESYIQFTIVLYIQDIKHYLWIRVPTQLGINILKKYNVKQRNE